MTHHSHSLLSLVVVPTPEIKLRHSLKLSSICKSASQQAVFSRMQLTLHATRRAPHGDSRLMQATMPTWSVKTRHAPFRHIVGMPGSMAIRLRPCRRSSISLLSSTPPPPPLKGGIFRAPVPHTAVRWLTRFVWISIWGTREIYMLVSGTHAKKAFLYNRNVRSRIRTRVLDDAQCYEYYLPSYRKGWNTDRLPSPGHSLSHQSRFV